MYLIQDKMWSRMVDIDTPRSVRAWRAKWLVLREKPSLPCRWPQLWHIGIRSVVLWVTLPCAGPGKRCSCGEPLPHTLTQSLSLSDALSPHIHTSKHALSLWGCISSSANSEKNKPPSESNIWPASNRTHLLGSN